MPVVTTTTERLRGATGRERVGQVGVGDADPGLGHVGERAEPVDHARAARAPAPGVTSRAPIAFIATVSELYHWNQTSAEAADADEDAIPTPP